MEGSSNASGATPEGVRTGDRAALQAVVDRRGPAVIAFCTQVCGPQDATRAAAEAFARFRAAVRDAPDLTGMDPEVLLRGATRHAAASMARVPVGPPPHGRLRSRGTQTCEHVPTMLAARANSALGEADLERLARHLDRCERCNAMAEIFHRAELNYQDPPFDTLGTETSTVLLDALKGVPMEAIGVAPAPDPDAPAHETIDGAFGHLPDLEDEVPIEITRVEAPAEELEAADLAAEPLPDEEPPAAEPQDAVEPQEAADAEASADHEESAEAGDSGEFEVVYGATAEWDGLVALREDHEAEPVHLEPAAPGAILEPGRRRRGGGATRAVVIGVPVVVVAAALVAALFLAGVFGGSSGTPARVAGHTPTGIQAPVTTPLPVTVAASAKPAGAGTSTSAARKTKTTASGTTPPTGTTP
jgi:hypothetical protein